MSSTQEIKGRINTISNIRKITHAMELVSSNKLLKAKKEFNNIKNYVEQIDQTIEALATHMTKNEIDDHFSVPSTGKNLYIIIGSDLGLAGSHNSNIIKLAKKTVGKQDLMILVGLKVIHALDKHKEQIVKMYSDVTSNYDQITREIIPWIIKNIQEHNLRNVYVIYNKYVNNLIQEESVLNLYPFEIKQDNDYKHTYLDDIKIVSLIEFEPSAKAVFDEALPLFLTAKLSNCFANSTVSELASRRQAMEKATDNAGELIEDLKLEFNRKRQSNITQELNEIVAGADAV
ncbi:ATP synthase F1 subunit gamma [Mycoplasmopsis opalescens]|uniref:ATP synthase F1 subunit gamma n=1 Tax=Mycoplasmopsis opalescens TaxID=114886 RepID=UPI0004A7370D|nr:ATP synthase F1 subunit gamma [Mycoplasmopsis opalescens]